MRAARTGFRRAALGLSLLILGCAGAPPTGSGLDPRAAEFAAPRFVPPVPVEAKLQGGAKVYLAEDHDIALVRLSLVFRGGALYDPPEKAGLSTVAASAWRTGGTLDKSTEVYDDELEAHGIELGLSLGRETGGVSLSVLPKDLDRGLDLLAELLLRPAFAETRVQWAKKLAQDALRREEDDPQSLAFRELRRALYRGHPRGIVATSQTIDAVTRDDLTALQARLVTESAWTVGAVGDFNREHLLERLNARFGMLKGDSAIFGPIPSPSAPAPRLVIVPKALPQTTLLWAAFGPDAVSPERAAVQVADYVLGGGGFQSRLTREVRSERGLAYDVESFYSAYPGFGVLGGYASTASATAPEVWRILTDQIEKAGSASFEEGEVRWARRTIENRHIFRFRDPADLVRERMSLEIQGLPPDLTERLYKDIEGLTPEAVNHAASGYYHTVRGVWVLVGEVSPEDPAWKGVWSVETVARPAEK